MRGCFILLIIAIHATAAGEPAPRVERIINWGGGWKDGQVQEPVVLPNPKDPGKLIMIFAGAILAEKGGVGCIAKAWASVADPLTWHEDPNNPILKPDPSAAFESQSIRLDSAIYNEATDEYWIYYTGHNGKTNVDAIGLATCPAGKDGYTDVRLANVKRNAGNPILSPGGQGRDDEKFVSQGAIFREGGVWYSFYSYRTATQTLPGIRLATSSDGKQWKKELGPDLLSAAPESQYYEWHQVYKIGERYYMMLEAYNGGKRWRANVATSSKLREGWKKAPIDLIDQTKWPGYSDELQFHVATPAIYSIGGKWYLFVQAAHSGYYIVQRWAMYGLEFDDSMKKILELP